MPYVPFNIDFDELATEVRADQARRKMPAHAIQQLDAAVRHIRDEVPDLADRDIARVLLAAGILTGKLIARDPRWNDVAMTNLLLGTGTRLWPETGDGIRAQPAADEA